MPDFTVPISLLRKPFENLYLTASGKLQEKIGQIKTASKIRELHKRLWESQRIKTIWHTDRPLSLSSFFYPVSVNYTTSSGNNKTQLASLDDLPDLHNLLFGTAGQGKSILLRYLLGKEIRSGTRVPLLCELRNVGNNTLETHLITRLGALLDINADAELFKFFAVQGKITFLLDGFDEVEPQFISALMSQLEDLSNKYSTCRIVITSRPDSECKHLTNFHSLDVAPLSLDDLRPFYKKVTRGDSAFADKLVAAINASPLQIKQLVVTPLLATLLAISYRAAQKIPLEFSEFYEELFQILLIRHDGSKLGWRRSRKTKLTDREIQQAFEALCFSTRKRQLATIENELLHTLAAASLSATKSSANADDFLYDIRKITCLLVEEGKKTTFVHSSVAEFFAARYIKSRPEDVAKSFYEKLVADRWSYWQQELLFLQQIDTHRATKYFLIPDLHSSLSSILSDISEVGILDVHRYLEGLGVKKSFVERDGTKQPAYYTQRNRPSLTYHQQALDSRAFRLLFQNAATPWNIGFLNDPTSTQRSYLQISRDRGEKFANEFDQHLLTAIKLQINMLQEWRQSIAAEEQLIGFANIDDI
ncbi:NACHT domain-containing protein [Variovorax guangxiensis]|uniref:NACHT domain-containing protein n=1 Tax=Variovorax guangxiensis TaxID=1775474 RepID=A0A3S0ZCZ7_9BURK|nr:NACHT domain-containing protein [Variovorax guangxiensis]RUR66812.1 NACHT domain-containing protein [Variovorax guangxiensis]